ncbi:hypothetical protein [Cupriavidus pauculus]|nr:hypothetical protein [Cupriavidus pauculus]
MDAALTDGIAVFTAAAAIGAIAAITEIGGYACQGARHEST